MFGSNALRMLRELRNYLEKYEQQASVLKQRPKMLGNSLEPIQQLFYKTNDVKFVW